MTNEQKHLQTNFLSFDWILLKQIQIINLYIIMTTQAYLTQPKNKEFKNKMLQYVESIQNKIERAKWKQNLILTYNYIPLQMTKDKIQAQKLIYLKKMQSLSARVAQQTKNEQIENQVQQFRDFSTKLASKMKQIQHRIDLLKMGINVQMATLEDKKQNLKNVLKENAQLTKYIINNRVKKMNTDYSTKSKYNSKTVEKNKMKKLIWTKQTEGSQTAQKVMKQSMYTAPSVSGFYSNRQRYEDCVEQVVKALKKMNASQDVQAGIYLQIMNRKFSNKSATYSLKSKACDVLMDRYKDLKHQKPKQNQDFSMSLDTFLGLNWKQIMGIILVKDRNALQLRNLLNINNITKI